MKRPVHRKKTASVPGPGEKNGPAGREGEHKRDTLPPVSPAAAGGAETAGSTREVVAFAMGACAVYYLFVVTSTYGDFQGDSSEYLGIAANMKSGVFTLASYNYLRGLLYPWFLSVTWGHQGFLTYFVQVTLFLSSFYLALRTLALNSIYCLLPIAAALIPAVTFLQRQIYPDGILVSLTLMFLICLARRRWAACAAIGLLLGLTKLIFLCVLPVELVVFMLIKRIVNPKILAWSVAAALISLPVCVVLFSYVFIDLGYMVIFARPYSHGYTLEEVFPGKELQVTCRGVQHNIPRKDLYFDPITVPFIAARYGPLTEEQVSGFGCTDADVRVMKRSLLLAGFVRHPLLHVRLAAEHFGKALVGAYFFGHVSYILKDRQDSWLAHYDALSYFSPYELILVEGYEKNGFRVQEKERPLSFVLNEFSAGTGEPLVRAAAVGMLGLCVIAGFIKGRLGELARDPINIGISLFLFVYAYLVGLSAPFLYDRYTYVNLIVFCILAARIAAMTLGAKARPAQS